MDKEDKIKKKEDKKQIKQSKEFDELKAKCQEYLHGWQRAQADFQNLEKNTDKKMAEFRKYACSDMLMQILPLADYFKHAFAAVPKEEKNSEWMQGMKHIQTFFNKFLADHDVEEIKTIGEKFNPEFHEAIKEEKGGKDHVIIKETQSGFMLNGKVIQPAKVIISVK